MEGCDKLVDAGRRVFFARTAAAAAGAAVTASLPVSRARAAEPAPALALVTYPSAKLANIKDLKVDEPTNITYPDSQSPGVLLKLGHPVVGGAGPDQDIVAFSTMCPHKGFPLFYRANDRSLNCPGHYSRFDVEKGGLEIWGHATQNLPQFRLRVDGNGDIYAEGVDELLYGRLSNVLQA
ncbi:MAG: arsenate reductase (azurin) small subunit [Acetobacteraceae bacterium]|nr:arsenate reductase (azurin) small subunit [Acetobacteraceae bacterium]